MSDESGLEDEPANGCGIREGGVESSEGAVAKAGDRDMAWIGIDGVVSAHPRKELLDEKGGVTRVASELSTSRRRAVEEGSNDGAEVVLINKVIEGLRCGKGVEIGPALEKEKETRRGGGRRLIGRVDPEAAVGRGESGRVEDIGSKEAAGWRRNR